MPKFGFTAAAVAMTTGVLGSKQAMAMTVNEEDDRQKKAKYTMNVATAYILGASRTYPIMQMDFKENVQNATNGQVYVKLAPGGPANLTEGVHRPAITVLVEGQGAKGGCCQGDAPIGWSLRGCQRADLIQI